MRKIYRKEATNAKNIHHCHRYRISSIWFRVGRYAFEERRIAPNTLRIHADSVANPHKSNGPDASSNSNADTRKSF